MTRLRKKGVVGILRFLGIGVRYAIVVNCCVSVVGTNREVSYCLSAVLRLILVYIENRAVFTIHLGMYIEVSKLSLILVRRVVVTKVQEMRKS